MGRPFDIFRLDPNGGAVRCAVTNSIDEALTTIEQFNKIERGIEFLILNQETKEQIIVKPASPSHVTHTNAR